MTDSIRDTEKIRPHPAAVCPEPREVRLLPGSIFYDRQQDMCRFLLGQDTGSMLYSFRRAAGLPTRGAEPLTGWDAEDCKLRGHTTGHYMSALALGHAATGDRGFRGKLEEIITGLAECQKAFADSGRTRQGFLSAYDEEQFDLLEQMTPYPEIWAPYYTLDKIMSGLLDAYELAGTEQALEILDPLGSWVYRRLSGLGAEHRARMWDTYIAGEYGCMISTMVRLHRITGRAEHLEAALLFENPALYDQMEEGRDALDTMHANQHIPQIMGAMELYRETGDKRYLRIAENFWHIVTRHHCYRTGGTGEGERWHEADSECLYLTGSTAESCASYNMLRLTTQLYESADAGTGASELMAYYENTLFNHLLISMSPRPDGGTTYFMPLAPGSSKHYETSENSCCHGTGMESRFRFMTQIFAYRDDASTGFLCVELPVSAALSGGRERITSVCREDGGVLRMNVRADRDMRRQLAVRIPIWAEEYEAHTLKSGDDADCGILTEAGYIITGRPLKEGEELLIEFPEELRRIRVPSDESCICYARGPHMLGVLSSSREFISEPEPGSLVKLCDIDTEPYHIYFRT